MFMVRAIGTQAMSMFGCRDIGVLIMHGCTGITIVTANSIRNMPTFIITIMIMITTRRRSSRSLK